MCANWRHVRASADDYWWLWILVPLWHDGPHIQGGLYSLCHHLVHLHIWFFRIICPRKSARIWFCRLLPRFIPNTYYSLKQLNSLMQRSYGSCIINRSAGNQKRRQLWRVLQDGNYHQGKSVKRWNKQEKMRKNYVFSCWPSTTRMAWRGSCGWTTSCPSNTKLGLKTIFLEDAVVVQTTKPNVKETCIRWNNF